MQHVSIVCIGKLNQAFYASGVAEYTKRLSAFCRFEITELPEEAIDEKNASAALIDMALKKEAAKILDAVPRNAQLVSLCIEGKQLTSENFSKWLENAAIAGCGTVAFVIGSSHGLADSIKQKSTLRLSLSGMTFPHQLARLMLTEQIYRAFTIRAGSKYHK
ncbi:MAG: 23S rRNA (pseudouridine(1915)-N(3))-methyltransferase RlmH [Oscillospiraceae bacterium]